MDLTDIILWTISLTLGAVGIIFGIIASYNSSKANKRIQELISSSWVNDESQKLFFTNIKATIVNNKKTLTVLKRENVKYNKYATPSSLSRMIPISQTTIQVLSKTEFKELSEQYLETKKFLDRQFIDIIEDFSILQTDEKIPKTLVKKLIKYHTDAAKKADDIIKSYNRIINATKEIKIG